MDQSRFKGPVVFLNARDTFHRVTEVNGYRLSVIYHTPQHLQRLTPEDWETLRDSGFPVDAVWELGLSFPEDDQEEDIGEVFQTLCESVNMTPQITPGSEEATEQDVTSPTLPDSAILRPTLQAILWISEIVARSGTNKERVPHEDRQVDSDKITQEMTRVNCLIQMIANTKETSLIVVHLAENLNCHHKTNHLFGDAGPLRSDAFTCS